MIDEKEAQKIISACTHAIGCERGSFYPNKDFGSLISKRADELSLLSCVRQATAEIDGVYIKAVQKQGDIIFVDLMINEHERRIEVNI